MATIVPGDIKSDVFIRDNDYDRQVELHILNRSDSGRASHRLDADGKRYEIEDGETAQNRVKPLVTLGVSDARRLTDSLAKWAERHGFRPAPDHAEKLTVELKLVTQERDFLRGLIKDMMTPECCSGENNTFTLSDIDKAVADVNRLQAKAARMAGPQGHLSGVSSHQVGSGLELGILANK